MKILLNKSLSSKKILHLIFIFVMLKFNRKNDNAMLMSDNNVRREDVYSRAIKAGNRTYFFDVKSTKAGENFITITESKKKFNNNTGKFYFEKHKVYLYKEDFEKFEEGFRDVIEFTEKFPTKDKIENNFLEKTIKIDPTLDVSFEDLGADDKTEI